MIKILALTVLLFLSCAPKPERKCPPKDAVLSAYSNNEVPESFVVYGKVKYGPLKKPFMLAKSGDSYRIKVAGVKKVSLSENKLCLEEKCYLLPLPVDRLLFGKVLEGYSYSFCSGGQRVFKIKGGVYESLVTYVNTNLRELQVVNLRNRKSIRVTFGDRDERGFYREVSFESEGEGFDLIVEEVKSDVS